MSVYFVDSKLGNNSNSGLTAKEAFKDFEIINEMSLKAGDKILLKRDCVFTDHLVIKASGEENSPIEISSYGEGLKKPAIITDDGSEFAVAILGEYVKLSGLEISNPEGIYGIMLKSSIHGATRGVTVSGCYIHDIWTINDLGPRDRKPQVAWHHHAGGISVETNREAPTWYENLRIEHNVIENVNRTGIWLGGQWNNRFKNTLNWMANKADSMDDPWYPHKDVYIGWNNLDHAHGDGIVCIGCINALVEHNRCFYANCMSREGNSNVAIWTMNCTGALVQYNEAAYTGHEYGGDGEGFDIDQCNIDNIFQYNYSHHNAGGFMLVCNGCNNKDSMYNNIIRNNLSVNDATNRDDPIFTISATMRNIYYVNNTIYTSNKNRFQLFRVCDYLLIGPPRDIFFRNNLFYSESTYNWNDFEYSGKVSFENNLFYNMPKLPQEDNITDSKNEYNLNPALQGDGTVPGTRIEAKAFLPVWNSPILRMGRHFDECADKDYFGTNCKGHNYIGAFYYKDANIG